MHLERLVIELGWPDRRLSPNARVFWATRSRLVKRFRRDAAYVTASVKPPVLCIVPGERIYYQLAYAPPDRRQRDEDNLEASLKSYRDGIADSLGVNDKLFSREGHIERLDPQRPGRIVFTFFLPVRDEV